MDCSIGRQEVGRSVTLPATSLPMPDVQTAVSPEAIDEVLSGVTIDEIGPDGAEALDKALLEAGYRNPVVCALPDTGQDPAAEVMRELSRLGEELGLYDDPDGKAKFDAALAADIQAEARSTLPSGLTVEFLDDPEELTAPTLDDAEEIRSALAAIAAEQESQPSVIGGQHEDASRAIHDPTPKPLPELTLSYSLTPGQPTHSMIRHMAMMASHAGINHLVLQVNGECLQRLKSELSHDERELAAHRWGGSELRIQTAIGWVRVVSGG